MKYLILALFLVGCASQPDDPPPVKIYSCSVEQYHVMDISGDDEADAEEFVTNVLKRYGINETVKCVWLRDVK